MNTFGVISNNTNKIVHGCNKNPRFRITSSLVSEVIILVTTYDSAHCQDRMM